MESDISIFSYINIFHDNTPVSRQMLFCDGEKFSAHELTLVGQS